MVTEKPCEAKTDFFLQTQSNQRKLLGRLRKNGFGKQACSGQQDKVLEKVVGCRLAGEW